MKNLHILIAILALVLASLACQTVLGGGDGDIEAPDLPQTESDVDIPSIPPVITDGSGDTPFGGESEFPLPDAAINVVNMGSDVVNFQTNLSLNEGMNFYRDQFGKLGYTERDLLTVTSAGTFSMVFDGHESGKAIAVQGVDLGDGTINISITLTDL